MKSDLIRSSLSENGFKENDRQEPRLAGDLGHQYTVLVSSYASLRELPPEQYSGNDVAAILGIADLNDDWIAKHKKPGSELVGKVIPLLEAS